MTIDLLVETKIDHYTLEALVGSGASGEVWRATDGERKVAIKFMNTGLLNHDNRDKHLGRFQTEIEALERLGIHGHIPSLYGYNLKFERPYLVMQYSHGPSFAEMIASGKMMLNTIKKRLDLIESVAETVQFIHKGGYLHRDIKPANIRGVNHPMIIDFSIALPKLNAAEADPNIGTGIYMPPPDGRLPDELHDSFSFALVAYEVLFGQHAIFKPENTGNSLMESRNLMRKHIQERTWHVPTKLAEAELPGSLRGANLLELDMIFQRALGENYTRYDDLPQFVRDLRSAIDIPDNEPYMEYVPSMPPTADNIPEIEHYTAHEVENATQSTDLNLEKEYYQRDPRRIRRVYTARTVIVTILGIIALAMLIFVLFQSVQ